MSPEKMHALRRTLGQLIPGTPPISFLYCANSPEGGPLLLASPRGVSNRDVLAAVRGARGAPVLRGRMMLREEDLLVLRCPDLQAEDLERLQAAFGGAIPLLQHARLSQKS